MTRLTKIEKETIILFNEGESTASIYTYNAGLKKRLAAFSKKYPDLCQMEKPEHLGGVSYLIDKSPCFPSMWKNGRITGLTRKTRVLSLLRCWVS